MRRNKLIYIWVVPVCGKCQTGLVVVIYSISLAWKYKWGQRRVAGGHYSNTLHVSLINTVHHFIGREIQNPRHIYFGLLPHKAINDMVHVQIWGGFHPLPSTWRELPCNLDP